MPQRPGRGRREAARRVHAHAGQRCLDTYIQRHQDTGGEAGAMRVARMRGDDEDREQHPERDRELGAERERDTARPRQCRRIRHRRC
jgi:hypothetical protein